MKVLRFFLKTKAVNIYSITISGTFKSTTNSSTFELRGSNARRDSLGQRIQGIPARA